MKIRNMTELMIQRQLRKHRTVSLLLVIFLSISVLSFLAGTMVREKAYQKFIDVISDSEEEQKYLLRAIGVCPEKATAYLLLLEQLNEDGVFSEEESKLFLETYDRYSGRLSSWSEEYAKLHYTAGFYYMNSFDAPVTTLLRVAVPFFEKAEVVLPDTDGNKFAVDCYCKLGNYYRLYVWDASATLREVKPSQMQQMVRDLYDTLLELFQDPSSASEKNLIGLAAAICNLFYDQRDALAKTVAYEDMCRVLDTVYNTIPKPDQLHAEEASELLLFLLSHEDQFRDAILQAYNTEARSNES